MSALELVVREAVRILERALVESPRAIRFADLDPWQPRVAEWLEDPAQSWRRGVLARDVLLGALGINRPRRGDRERAGRVLRALGWRRGCWRDGANRRYHGFVRARVGRDKEERG